MSSKRYPEEFKIDWEEFKIEAVKQITERGHVAEVASRILFPSIRQDGENDDIGNKIPSALSQRCPV